MLHGASCTHTYAVKGRGGGVWGLPHPNPGEAVASRQAAHPHVLFLDVLFVNQASMWLLWVSHHLACAQIGTNICMGISLQW
jgi:hypothetical protein